MAIEYFNYLFSIVFDHCFLFVFYIILNISDYITGTMKAYITKTESSKTGEKGIIKKFSYWILLFISFLLPIGFEELGKILDINFGITELLGWFILVSMIINEIRSILENLVSIGCKVPTILTTGLEIASAKINEREELNDEINN